MREYQQVAEPAYALATTWWIGGMYVRSSTVLKVLRISALLVLPVAVLLIHRGRWGDRSAGRPRCLGCWYDMIASLPRLICPECGHDPKHQCRLYRDRQQRLVVVVGVVLAVVCVVRILWPVIVSVGQFPASAIAFLRIADRHLR